MGVLGNGSVMEVIVWSTLQGLYSCQEFYPGDLLLEDCCCWFLTDVDYDKDRGDYDCREHVGDGKSGKDKDITVLLLYGLQFHYHHHHHHRLRYLYVLKTHVDFKVEISSVTGKILQPTCFSWLNVLTLTTDSLTELIHQMWFGYRATLSFLWFALKGGYNYCTTSCTIRNCKNNQIFTFSGEMKLHNMILVKHR